MEKTAEKPSWTLEESRINYSVQELEENGVKIFRSNTNRLQDFDLIDDFTDLLKSGGKYFCAGKLVNARECLKAGRVLHRSKKARGKGTRVTSESDFTDTERAAYNNGLCLVVFDGNHRYNAMINALEGIKDPKERKRIKGSVFFTYEDISAPRLPGVFLEINTKNADLEKQDVIPYILKNHGNKGNPIYEFDWAIDSLQRAKYAELNSDKKRQGLFNHKAALLLCCGGEKHIPRSYERKEELVAIALYGKPDTLPKQCMTSDTFKELILVPYIFEKYLGEEMSKLDWDLITHNYLRFLSRILARSEDSNEIIAFAKYLAIKGGKELLKDYTKKQTLRDKSGVTISSNEQRDQLLKDYYSDFKKEDIDYLEVTKTFHLEFDEEVSALESKMLANSEKLERGEINSGSFRSAYKTNTENAKLSVVAMYLFKNERD